MPTAEKFSPKDENTIREEVTNEFKELGYDPELEENKPLLETLVKKELDKQTNLGELHGKLDDTSKKLGQAITQKKKRDEIIESLKQANKDEEPEDTPAKPNEESPAPEAPQNNEEISAIKSEIASLKAERHREKFSHLSDEEYGSLLNLAGGLDKFNKEFLETNPIAKNYMETNKVNERVAGATAAPSNRAGVTANLSFEEVDLGNPEHVNKLKADGKMAEYEAWLDKHPESLIH